MIRVPRDFGTVFMYFWSFSFVWETKEARSSWKQYIYKSFDIKLWFSSATLHYHRILEHSFIQKHVKYCRRYTQFTCQSSIFVITHSILYIFVKVKSEYIIGINEYLISIRRESMDMRKVQHNGAEHFDMLSTFVYFCHWWTVF